jgi:hypothetical protein
VGPMGYDFWWLLSLGLIGLCFGLGLALLRKRQQVSELWDLLRHVRNEVSESLDDLDASIPKQQIAAAEMKRLQELTDHLSEAIGIMQKSRDQWKEMFFVQAHEHGNGQAVLERALTRNREYVLKLVAAVNAERKAKGMDPITKVEQLDDPPLGTAEAYREAMRELADKAPEDPDMVAERDRLLSAK